jgi:hypothetical protein
MTALSDRELLELAAKAAGYTCDFLAWGSGVVNVYDAAGKHAVWNPLEDEGDALRLAVKLRLTVHTYDEDNSPSSWGVSAGPMWVDECVPHDSDPYASTRRAIVCAAAAIGQTQSASGVELPD